MDSETECRFIYDRITKEVIIGDNNKPAEEILPIPVWWLDRKLSENEKRNEHERRICWLNRKNADRRIIL